YVDEVQYPATILCNHLVTVSLCRNPDGFLWAGDTVQTIYIWSTFGFKELGAFVYRYQVRDSDGTIREADRSIRALLVNCRSHGGIVKCANAIIQLFQRFPSAIDVLQPEAGVARSEISEMPKFFIANVFLPENAISSLCQRECA
ncbi:hypothetical protein EDB89DRAFT_1842811, partial [Lactarius sanguifluus]